MIGYGDIKYARLITADNDIALYRYEDNDGNVDYFDRNGKSTKNSLMKTPVDGARMSSGYGMRRHPVLGYDKMHKGVDFAAPTGTPIYAAGDGVVEKAARWGGYGNYVKIRHNSSLKTAYAHMHSIKVKAGTRVKQGQIIGTVGTTGRSTGPHLHYEVLMGGKQVDPRGVNVPVGEELRGASLKKFKDTIGVYEVEFSTKLKTANYPQVSSLDRSNTTAN
jgi:murein DD-endopeptidase MepM/ murein hydrolase activator NlpD